jgi:hypothetical protein
VIASGTAANKGGGIRVYNSTLIAGGTNGFQTITATYLSTSIPCEIHNSIALGATNALSAATSGQLVESYNYLWFGSGLARVNVTAGTGSIADGSYALLVELGQSLKWNGFARLFFAPDGATSPLLGFGNVGSGSDPLTDWQNRLSPSGGGSTSHVVGYMELHDFAIQDTTTYPTGQTSSAKLVGPGDQEILVPVDAVSTTISIKLYQGSGYTGTNYASATLLANGELGIASQVQTCASTTGAWQTLTFSGITASKAGYVKIRISSFDTSGTGTLNFGALAAV